MSDAIQHDQHYQPHSLSPFIRTPISAAGTVLAGGVTLLLLDSIKNRVMQSPLSTPQEWANAAASVAVGVVFGAGLCALSTFEFARNLRTDWREARAEFAERVAPVLEQGGAILDRTIIGATGTSLLTAVFLHSAIQQAVTSPPVTANDWINIAVKLTFTAMFAGFATSLTRATNRLWREAQAELASRKPGVETTETPRKPASVRRTTLEGDSLH